MYARIVIAVLRNRTDRAGEFRQSDPTEDHMRMWQPASGKVIAKGPVITRASRSQPRHALHVQPVVRAAVHPGDVTVPALLGSIAATFKAFAARRPAGRYADLLTR